MQVLCGQCGKTIQMDDRLVGQIVTCPHCKREIPLSPSDAAGAPSPPVKDLDRELPEDDFVRQAKKAMARNIRIVTCGSCGKHLSVGIRLAGKGGKCPACGKPIQIPALDEQDDIAMAQWAASASAARDNALEIVEAEEPGQAEQAAPVAMETELVEAVLQKAHSAAPVESPADAVAPLRPREARPRSKLWIVYAAVPVVVIGLMAALWLMSGPPMQKPRSPGPSVRRQGLAGMPATASQTAPAIAQGPIGSQPRPDTGVPAVGAVPPAPTTGTASSALRLLEAKPSVFAVGGYFPARPGWTYWTIRIAVNAEDKPVAFNANGPDVIVKLAGASYESLGLQAGESVVPVRAQRKAVHIPSGEAREIALLFEAPSAAEGEAVLTIQGLGGLHVMLPAPAALPAEAVVGAFEEEPPRNLKILETDPVIAAIQAAAQTMIVQKGKEPGTLGVTLPAAGVSGSIAPGRDGLYDLTLWKDDKSVNGKVRLFDGGKRLILYFSEQPFSGLTFVRQ